jgi:phosphoribosylglycinamide formyltransferase-1
MRLAVLLSGRGSNFLAIRDAIARGVLDAEIVVVVSNRPDAPGLARARELALPAFAADHKAYPSRVAHEAEVLRVLAVARPDYIALAGYMRLLSPTFVAAYPSRILNIHPSLLPAFPGVDAQGQALAAGVKISGCTVHFVDENLDAGPILVQRAVPVLPDDTTERLAARILVQEHEAYVEALRGLSRARPPERSGGSQPRSS